MTAPTPTQVLNAVKLTGLRYATAPGWDDPTIAAKGTWDPGYVILHHTANGGAPGNTPSLGYIVKGTYPPIRNCHFLIGRDGLVVLVYALKCYHAGAGGPGQWGDGPAVPVDVMNGFGYGIEIESRGTSLTVDATNGYTPAQIAATATLTAALLDLLGRSTGCTINHKTWAPNRKVDTLLADATWQAFIAPRRAGEDMALEQADIDKVAHAVWNKEYTDPTDGKLASTASLVLRGRIDSHTAATRTFPTAPPPTSTSLSDADVERIATRVADLLAARMQS